jgi:hypothetical protein
MRAAQDRYEWRTLGEAYVQKSAEIIMMMMTMDLLRPMWCPGQKSKVTPLPFFQACRKKRLTSEINNQS